MKKLKTTIKVIERKLGREKSWGLAYKNKNLIEIDERLRWREKLIVLCHELAHKAFPHAKEKEILKAEKIIGNTLWSQNFRQVDNYIK